MLASASADGKPARVATDADDEGKRRYAVKPPVHPDPYAPRLLKGGIELFDLGLNPDGTTWNFEIPAAYPFSANQDFQDEVMARFVAAEYKQIKYENSWRYSLDIINLNDDTDYKIYAIAEPGLRQYVPDHYFTVPTGNTSTPEWTSSNKLKVTDPKQHLRINACFYVDDFDTTDTTHYKVTSTADPTDTEVTFDLSAETDYKIYLIPTVDSEGVGSPNSPIYGIIDRRTTTDAGFIAQTGFDYVESSTPVLLITSSWTFPGGALTGSAKTLMTDIIESRIYLDEEDGTVPHQLEIQASVCGSQVDGSGTTIHTIKAIVALKSGAKYYIWTRPDEFPVYGLYIKSDVQTIFPIGSW